MIRKKDDRNSEKTTPLVIRFLSVFHPWLNFTLVVRAVFHRICLFEGSFPSFRSASGGC